MSDGFKLDVASAFRLAGEGNTFARVQLVRYRISLIEKWRARPVNRVNRLLCKMILLNRIAQGLQ